MMSLGLVPNMNQVDIKKYVLQHLGTPYNKQDISTHSIETGFNCLTWGAHLYNLYDGDKLGKISTDLTDLKVLRSNFVEATPPLRFMDIACFAFDSLGRHIAIMLDDRRFTHISDSSNGVAISKIDTLPWKELDPKYYRHKLL